MEEVQFFDFRNKKNAKIYLIGIKGTGMCALAELLHKRGFLISGSDGKEVFYTDALLKELQIPYHETFDAAHIDKSLDLVIYSAAYSFSVNPEMDRALELGIPILKYTDALGAYSKGIDSTGIAGVHGKTSTTAMTGTLLAGLNLPVEVLAGSEVSNFGGRSTLSLGHEYFIAETCEYRKHFLSFHPKRIILTSVETDHQDFFPTYEDIRDAFVEYGRLLPPGGEMIYCADDKGACEVAAILSKERPNINFVPYGFNADGDFKVINYQVKNERILMKLASFSCEFRIRIPGLHSALNAAAAIALCSSIVKDYYNDGWTEERRKSLVKALEDFSGSRRRSEILGTKNGIVFMDDYGHHPTEIKSTLSGLRDFFPERRFIVSFMSHTYTRTEALLDEFADSFSFANIVLLHKIYSSAREVYNGGITGLKLFDKVKERFNDADEKNADARNVDARDVDGSRVFYIDEPDESIDFLKGILKSGDLFITMGAGDNFRMGKKLYDSLIENQGGRK